MIKIITQQQSMRITDCCDFSVAHVQSLTAEENPYYSGTDRQLRIELTMDNKAGVLTFWLVQNFNVSPMVKVSFTTRTVSTHPLCQGSFGMMALLFARLGKLPG